MNTNGRYRRGRLRRRPAPAGDATLLNTIATAPAAGLCGRCAALRTPRRHRPPETRAGGAGPAAARHLRTPAARSRTTAARPRAPPRRAAPQRPRTTAPRHTRTRDVPARARRATPRMGPDTLRTHVPATGYRVRNGVAGFDLRDYRVHVQRLVPSKSLAGVGASPSMPMQSALTSQLVCWRDGA